MRPAPCRAASRIGTTYPKPQPRRLFHDYFVTHLPSSSLSPDQRSAAGPNHHKLPRSESKPHNKPESRSPAAIGTSGSLTAPGVSRETTVVRIPLRSAKHHFGAGVSRGSRPYNEDTYQAGTIEIPAFAKRQPVSLSRRGAPDKTANRAAESASGDPQVFYFGVFDGHGGDECSHFLRERLHGYLEDAAVKFGVESTLKQLESSTSDESSQKEDLQSDVLHLQRQLVNAWRDTVGGYFKRFRPEYFTSLQRTSTPARTTSAAVQEKPPDNINSLEAMLTYAFLHADLDFTAAQASKHTPSNSANQDDPVLSDKLLNENDVLSSPSRPASQNLTNMLSAPIGGKTRFQGGSTASVALISTPTATPFWHPASPATIVIAHVGDTRILLCRVSDGAVVPLTTNHHPSAPVEATRLRRYAATFVTDSFGEERVLGLANTRAFGDISSKRIGVSAEPEIKILDMTASEYSFLVLVSDGVTLSLDDQEIVDVVKEARTPEQASKSLVSFATEVAGGNADNATALVVRLGGWERRSEGGGGSIGTKEMREFKQREADDPRSSRM